MNQPALAASAPAPFLRRALAWWLAQAKHVLPPTIFFFVGFNLILWTKRLILEARIIAAVAWVLEAGATMIPALFGPAIIGSTSATDRATRRGGTAQDSHLAIQVTNGTGASPAVRL